MIEHQNCIEVYGFGSFFKGNCAYRDIDLLLIHEKLSLVSCNSAIDCKNKIQSLLPIAHITMLSVEEEKSFSFISKSHSIYLGHICKSRLQRDIESIFSVIRVQKEAYSKSTEHLSDHSNFV